MIRRPQYKGEADQVHSLPVDAASTLGIMCMIGTILPAKSLSNEALQTCRSILLSMERDGGPIEELVGKLQNGTKLTLEARTNGKFALKDIKPMFKKLGINFSRPGIEKDNHGTHT